MHRLPNWPLSAELIPDPLTETLASWKVSGVSEVRFVELKEKAFRRDLLLWFIPGIFKLSPVDQDVEVGLLGDLSRSVTLGVSEWEPCVCVHVCVCHVHVCVSCVYRRVCRVLLCVCICERPCRLVATSLGRGHRAVGALQQAGWWPAKRYVHILTPGTCASELTWKWGPCRCN